MWINQAQQTVGDNDQYTGPDGTTYPSGFPKSEIPGLTWQADPAPPAPTLEQRRDMLKAQATTLRWQHETGGLTLPNGVKVGTTTADQNRITSVISNAGLAGVESVDFKADSGWGTLAIEQVQAMAGAIALHVQACFSAERAHHEAIDALADSGIQSYDITERWPD